MGQVSLDDAVGVLDRFRTDGTPVYLSGMGFGWRIGIAGWISGVSAEEVRFALPNGDEALGLRMDMDDVTFWSGDVAELPGDLRRGIAIPDQTPAFVGILLPFRTFPEMFSGPVCDRQSLPRERLFFCELSGEPSGDPNGKRPGESENR